MKLEVFERLVLLNVLPQEGDFVTLKLVRKLRETLSFGEQEIALIDFKNTWRCPRCDKVELAAQNIKCPDCLIYMKTAGQVTWDEEKAKGAVKDIHLGELMKELCTSTLRRMNDEKKLTDNHYSLYRKFVEGEGGE